MPKILFEKGDPKIHREGRPKGIAPKRRIGSVKETLEKSGKNPIKAMWALYETTANGRLKKEILAYLIEKCEQDKKKNLESQVMELDTIEEAAKPETPLEETKDLVEELEKTIQANQEQ